MVELCSLFLKRFLYKLMETLVENNADHFNSLFLFFFPQNSVTQNRIAKEGE